MATESEEELEPCSQCGSDDILFCQISHRFHCAKCGFWPPPHWSGAAYAKKQWNKLNK
jgi:hypothetical protein